MLTCCAVGFAFAQNETANTAAPAAQTPVAEEAASVEQAAPAEATPAEATPVEQAEPAPVSTPVATPTPVAEENVAEPVSSASAAITGDIMKFNKVRGTSYNTVGNQAAFANIIDRLNSPSTFAGDKFAYLDPINEQGYIAFGSGLTYIFGWDNSLDRGLFTGGVAGKSFGITAEVALAKDFISVDYDGEDASSRVTQSGDLFGLNFSIPFGNKVFSVNVEWLTTATQVNNDDVDNDFWNLDGDVSLASSGNTSWKVGAHVLRTELSQEEGKTTLIDPDANITVQPYFNIGFPALSSQWGRVLMGLNTSIPVQLFDSYGKGDNETSHTEVGLLVSPNIFAEVALGNCWSVFGGASLTAKPFSYGVVEKGDVSTSDIQLSTYATNVSMGARFQYEYIGIDAAVSDQFFGNPMGTFNGGTYFTFNGFIYF